MADNRESDIYRDFITKVPVRQDDVDFFSSLPLAKPYINISSAYQPIPFMTRYDKENTSDTFFSRVINTPDTIPRLLALMRRTALQQSNNRGESKNQQAQGPGQPYFVTFVHLGSGVNGYQDTVHGGVLASLFDETLGLCAETFRQFASKDRARLYTASLTVSYRSPVTTPGVVLVKTWVQQVEGRKWFLEAQLLDADGMLKAEAKSLYIGIRTQAAL
ncbi:Thioesterase superfamily [Aspergillus sp. HF37]|nr:Thioesterase superfamily [Aspergillus sp. HF37]